MPGNAVESRKTQSHIINWRI